MKSKIYVSGRATDEFKRYAENVALECLKFMKQPDGLEVCIKFVSENEIKRLNKELRNIDKVTDVLSFPSTEIKVGEILNLNSPEQKFFMNEDGLFHFGDMAICSKRLREQALEFGVEPICELKKLVIHSMLHLMGYDHIEDSDYEVMNKKEIELTKLIK